MRGRNFGRLLGLALHCVHPKDHSLRVHTCISNVTHGMQISERADDVEEWTKNFQSDRKRNAAYKEQLNNLALASGKIIQDVGEMVASPRHALTLEQWRKLQNLQKAKRAAAKANVPPHQPAAHAPAAGDRP